MSFFTPLVIHCGASSVSVARFSEGGSGKRTLESFVTSDLVYDFSSDEEWSFAVVEKLKELSSSAGLSGHPATLILPGFRLLTKSFKIPHVEEGQRAQIIAFEAQQNIPYPLTEVVWDSQIIGDDGIETDCLFVAAKNDFIQSLLNQLYGIGMNVVQVTASSVLDHSAVRSILGSGADQHLLINIGARASNLIFIGENGFFVRNIALGGNSLTQQIADSIGLSFAKAEALKVKFFTGAESFAQDDPHVKMILNCAQQFMQRISTEVTRSTVNYRRQNKGKSVSSILLTGRGSLLSGFTDYLKQKQKVEVQYFDPLECVEIAPSVNTASLDMAKFQVSELFGLVSDLGASGSTTINLLPPHIQAEQRFSKQKPFYLTGALALGIAALLPFFYLSSKASALSDTAKSYKDATQPLLANQTMIADKTLKAEEIASKIQKVEGLADSRFNWAFFFADVQKALDSVRDAWLDELTVDRELKETSVLSQTAYDDFGNPLKITQTTVDYKVVLSGRMLLRGEDSRVVPDAAIDPSEITSRIRSLTQSLAESDFFTNVSDPTIDFTKLNEGLNLISFQLTLTVDSEKPL
ncbi:MAG: pilus assembly protein PilM [Opitutales bacterium]